MKNLLVSIVILCISTFSVSAETLIYENDFNEYGDWFPSNGVWEIGNVSDATGVAATILDGNYPVEQTSLFEGDKITLPEVSGDFEILQLRIWQKSWYTWYDYGVVRIRIYNGSTWEEWFDIGDYYNDHTNSSYWYERKIDLTLYAGKQIQLGLYHCGVHEHYEIFGVSINNHYESTGWYIDHISIWKCEPTFCGEETFENGYGFWDTQYGVWQIGERDPNCSNCVHSGVSCAATILEGNYPLDTPSRLISAPFILPATGNNDDELQIRFWHWYSYVWYDYGQVQISYKVKPSATTWEAWEDIGPRFSGTSGVWTPYRIDITKYAGKKIRIAFYHHEEHEHYEIFGVSINNHYESEGWYIDDIEIYPPLNDIITIVPQSKIYSFTAPTAEYNNIIIAVPTGMNLGDVSFGVLPKESEEDIFTDGQGITVNVNKGEGATIFGKPFEVEENDIVYIKISARSSNPNISLAVGALDAVMADTMEYAALDGSIGVNMLMTVNRFENQFQFLEALFIPERNAVVQYFKLQTVK